MSSRSASIIPNFCPSDDAFDAHSRKSDSNFFLPSSPVIMSWNALNSSFSLKSLSFLFCSARRSSNFLSSSTFMNVTEKSASSILSIISLNQCPHIFERNVFSIGIPVSMTVSTSSMSLLDRGSFSLYEDSLSKQLSSPKNRLNDSFIKTTEKSLRVAPLFAFCGNGSKTRIGDESFSSTSLNPSVENIPIVYHLV